MSEKIKDYLSKNSIPKKITYNFVDKFINEFPTQYKKGFLNEEVEIVKKYFNIKSNKFEDALMGTTGLIIDDKMIHYSRDIYYAVIYGLKGEDLPVSIWD